MKQKRYPTALTIAGSDSGGGAGIQADLKTFSSLGVYGASVITAVTAQNTCGVQAIQAIHPQIIESQISAVCSDFRIDALKLGMLHSPQCVEVVHRLLSLFPIQSIVLDPVMIATSGDSLIEQETIELIRSDLFPLITLLTPNCAEAALLSGIPVDSVDSLCQAGTRLLEVGCNAVLMKGGHLDGTMKTDVLMESGKEPVFLSESTVDTMNTHGTGCTLSSAITAFLALGFTLSESVQKAKKYVHDAIEAGADVYVGAGHGPLNHFFNPRPLVIK